MRREFIVYGLFDPRDGELRYVGKSETGLKHRVAEHCMPSYLSTSSHKNSWVKGLLAEQLKPVGAAIQVLSTAEELCGGEQYWISHFRSAGCRLTNMTEGGEGFGPRSVSAETRAKMRAAKLGKKQSPETIAKRATAQMGRRPTPETLIKLRAAAKLRGIHPATRAAATKAASSRVRSPEECLAQSKRLTLWWARRKAIALMGATQRSTPSPQNL